MAIDETGDTVEGEWTKGKEYGEVEAIKRLG
jgi:hypothetical protein